MQQSLEKARGVDSADPVDDSDGALLRAFARRRDQVAFATLVARHVDFVYSSALRQLRDPAAAEDVTQAVFIVLAQKAGSIRQSGALPAWLFKAVRFAVADLLKRRARRRHHEQEAAREAALMAERQERPSHSPPEPDWEQIGPVLDDALASLSQTSRSAVLLRFFQGRSHQDVAAELGISEVAARQRLSRALEQMRAFLIGRGVTAHLSASGLGALIASRATVPAPAALAGKSVSTGLCAHALHGTSSVSLAKGVITLMALSKTKALVGCALLLLLVGGGISAGLMWKGVARRNSIPQAVLLPHSPAQRLTNYPRQEVGPAVNSVSGTVLGPDGTPLANAEVFVQDANLPTYIDQTPPFLHPRKVVTGADGRFTIGVPTDRWYLVARHEQGVAWMNGHPETLAANGNASAPAFPTITLVPWGHVEGTCLINGKPLAGTMVHVEMRQPPSAPMLPMYNSIVQTNAQGHFSFPRVPAGTGLVAHAVDPGKGKYSAVTDINVQPGKTTTVSINAPADPPPSIPLTEPSKRESE